MQEMVEGVSYVANRSTKMRILYPMSLSIDHIIPLANGGTHEPKNVQIAHFICNSIKSNKYMPEQLRIC